MKSKQLINEIQSLIEDGNNPDIILINVFDELEYAIDTITLNKSKKLITITFCEDDE